jgi:hypothetical protein
VPGPRRSEDAPVVSGEAIKPAHADDRAVDAPGKILVTPSLGGTPVVKARPAPPVPVRSAMPDAPPRRGGAWIVVLVYILAAGALGYAIWERFLR